MRSNSQPGVDREVSEERLRLSLRGDAQHQYSISPGRYNVALLDYFG